jgi:ABC-type transport system substrate-binding protein
MKTLIERRLQLCTVAVAAMTALLAAPATAKGTLVYCSEGSPEGFQPQFFTTGTTFDAVSVPMFNRLVEFETGLPTSFPRRRIRTVSPTATPTHSPQGSSHSNANSPSRLQCRRRAVLVVPDG